MIGRNGDTIESIRELIMVPPEIERTLRLYLRWHPEDADGIERVLKFRSRVAKEFEELLSALIVPGTYTKNGIPSAVLARAHSGPSTHAETANNSGALGSIPLPQGARFSLSDLSSAIDRL